MPDCPCRGPGRAVTTAKAWAMPPAAPILGSRAGGCVGGACLLAPLPVSLSGEGGQISFS